MKSTYLCTSLLYVCDANFKNEWSSDLSFSFGRPRNSARCVFLCFVQLYMYVRIYLGWAVGARPRRPTPSGMYLAVLLHGLWNLWVWTVLHWASSTPMLAPAMYWSGVTTCAYQGVNFLLLSQVSATNPYQELNAPIIENWLPIFIKVEYLPTYTLILDSIEVQSCWWVQSSRKQGAMLQVERGRSCGAFWCKWERHRAFWCKREGARGISVQGGGVTECFGPSSLANDTLPMYLCVYLRQNVLLKSPDPFVHKALYVIDRTVNQPSARGTML